MPEVVFNVTLIYPSGKTTIMQLTQAAINFYRSKGIKISYTPVGPPKPPVIIPSPLTPPPAPPKAPEPAPPPPAPPKAPEPAPPPPAPPKAPEPPPPKAPEPAPPKPSTLPATSSPDIFGDVLKFMTGTYQAKDQRSEFLNYTAGARKEIEKAVVEAWKLVEGLIDIKGPVNIPKAFQESGLTAIPAMLSGFGIYLASTATDLLHPLKGTGLVPMGIELANALGPNLITRNIVGAYANVAIESPLTKYYNDKARPYRPAGGVADQMYFEGNITKEEWIQLYKWQGWPDNLITAQFKTMFIEPADRMLIAMFQDPELDFNWVNQKLTERGYNEADRKEMVRFAKSTAADKTRLTRLTSVISRYKKGYDTVGIMRAWLNSMQYRKDQSDKILVSAELDADSEYRDLQLQAYTTMYIDNQIQETEFIAILKQYIVNGSYRDAYFRLQKAKRIGKIDTENKIKQYEGSKSVAIARFVEGITNESSLTSELKSLNIPIQEIPYIIIEANLRKELELFKDSKIKTKEKTIKAQSGKESASVLRFVQGFTTKEIFQAELSTLGKTPEEIKLISLAAVIQRDTDYRKDQIALYKVAYEKDIITRDEFRTSLKPLISDNTALEQIIILEDLKKAPKPKVTP